MACEKVLVVLLQSAQNAAMGEQGGVVETKDYGSFCRSGD